MDAASRAHLAGFELEPAAGIHAERAARRERTRGARPCSQVMSGSSTERRKPSASKLPGIAGGVTKRPSGRNAPSSASTYTCGLKLARRPIDGLNGYAATTFLTRSFQAIFTDAGTSRTSSSASNSLVNTARHLLPSVTRLFNIHAFT